MPNIKIRSMHGQFSTSGLFLEDGKNLMCPKLQPGEVVEVPDNHPIFDSDASAHIEITREKANRPYEFDSVADAFAQLKNSREMGAQLAQGIVSSQEANKARRAENKARLKELAGEPPVEALKQSDAVQGLDTPSTDNAYVRGEEEDVPVKRRRGRPRKHG